MKCASPLPAHSYNTYHYPTELEVLGKCFEKQWSKTTSGVRSTNNPK